MIAELEPAELVAWRQDALREPPIVVDVREPWEFDYCLRGGVAAWADKIDPAMKRY